MYSLIKAGIATKSELDEAYTLDEALKLYALYSMDRDIERFQAEEMQAEMRQKARSAWERAFPFAPQYMMRTRALLLSASREHKALVPSLKMIETV